MAAIPPIDGKALLGHEQWQALTRPSGLRGALLILHAWGVIGAAVAVCVVLPHPAVIAIAIFVIGSRQLGLAILMHDAAHGLLLPNRRWNDRLGQWLTAWPVGIDMLAYRRYHLKHHRFAQQEEDPDLVLSAKFPVTRISLARKFMRDMSGLTFIKLRLLPLFFIPWRGWPSRSSDLPLIFSNLLFASVAWAAGVLWAWFWLWLVPLATWNMLVTRWRNIAEHACVPTAADPWRIARTTAAGGFWRALVAPYYVNYHVEHHLLMTVPCYRLPAMQRALKEKGAYAEHDVPVEPGYLAVLAAATRQA